MISSVLECSENSLTDECRMDWIDLMEIETFGEAISRSDDNE